LFALRPPHDDIFIYALVKKISISIGLTVYITCPLRHYYLELHTYHVCDAIIIYELNNMYIILEVTKDLSHASYLTCVSQDAAISAFTVKSAGTRSVTAFRSHGRDFIIPVITPVTMPVGPYKLSIQPGRGSLAVAITVKNIQ